jgi:hypothetical protein
MLQTDFITDLSVIHNSNVLLLKDQFELLINNLEIDVNGFTIGTDNAIQSIRTKNLLLKDTGMLFQKGTANTTIAGLTQDTSFNSLFNIDHIKMNRIATSSIEVNTINVETINTTSISTTGSTTITGPIVQEGPIVESTETILVPFTYDTVSSATGELVLSSTSRNNIYVKIDCATSGIDKVYNGSAIETTIADFKLIIKFDTTSPPLENSTFTIIFADVIASGSSIIAKTISPTFLPLIIETESSISLPSGILPTLKLGTNSASSDKLAQSNFIYNSGATFNYMIDSSSNKRLVIKSMVGLDVY